MLVPTEWRANGGRKCWIFLPLDAPFLARGRGRSVDSTRKRSTRQTEDEMGDTGWLIVAIVSGVLAVIGWVARERWIIRRRRRR